MDVDRQMFRGTLLQDVTVFGQSVDLCVRPDEHEVIRRSATHVGSVTNANVIRALMTLPAGIPIPMRALDPLDRIVVNELSAGVIRVRPTDVTRVLRPPLEIVGIVKHAHSWEDVQAVSLLRTHAPRLVVAPHSLALRVMREADPDIGVAEDPDLDVALRAAGGRWLKPSWQRWFVAEVAYERWRLST